MRSPEPDADMLIEALRADLPSAAEKDRARARLAAAGIIATTSLVAPSTAGGAATGTGGARGVPPGVPGRARRELRP